MSRLKALTLQPTYGIILFMNNNICNFQVILAADGVDFLTLEAELLEYKDPLLRPSFKIYYYRKPLKSGISVKRVLVEAINVDRRTKPMNFILTMLKIYQEQLPYDLYPFMDDKKIDNIYTIRASLIKGFIAMLIRPTEGVSSLGHRKCDVYTRRRVFLDGDSAVVPQFKIFFDESAGFIDAYTKAVNHYKLKFKYDVSFFYNHQ